MYRLLITIVPQNICHLLEQAETQKNCDIQRDRVRQTNKQSLTDIRTDLDRLTDLGGQTDKQTYLGGQTDILRQTDGQT